VAKGWPSFICTIVAKGWPSFICTIVSPGTTVAVALVMKVVTGGTIVVRKVIFCLGVWVLTTTFVKLVAVTGAVVFSRVTVVLRNGAPVGVATLDVVLKNGVRVTVRRVTETDVLSAAERFDEIAVPVPVAVELAATGLLTTVVLAAMTVVFTAKLVTRGLVATAVLTTVVWMGGTVALATIVTTLPLITVV
jgi:hypothetical protein